jgi:hypothetical protein
VTLEPANFSRKTRIGCSKRSRAERIASCHPISFETPQSCFKTQEKLLFGPPHLCWGLAAEEKSKGRTLSQSPLDKNLPLARPGPLPRGFRKPPLCIGRSSSRLLSPPLRYSKDQLSPHLPLQSLRKHRNFKAWPDLFTGDNICPMLIVFRADCYACLKHSSLFKVKILKTVK